MSRGMASAKATEPPAESPDTPGHDLADCIMAIARDRDRGAFAVLFRHFAPRVKSYLSRHGADPDVAEELAQETLLAVWHKAALFDPAKAGAATWVFRIARNLRIDAMRRERHPSAVPDLPPVPRLADGDERTAQAERERLVALALGDLPTEQAELVRLSYFEDRSHADIERRLGLPLGTVKSRLRLAMRRLRLAIGDQA